jgi:hypothetical protein
VAGTMCEHEAANARAVRSTCEIRHAGAAGVH